MLDRVLHPNSQAMLDAWRRLFQSGDTVDAPEPAAPADLISRLFVLRQDENGEWMFQTAGARLSAITGRTLEHRAFLDFWGGDDRGRVRALLSSIALENQPGIIRADGRTLNGRIIPVEIPLAPLIARDRARMLGLYQTLDIEPALQSRPLWRHDVTDVFPAAQLVERPALRLVVSN